MRQVRVLDLESDKEYVLFIAPLPRVGEKLSFPNPVVPAMYLFCTIRDVIYHTEAVASAANPSLWTITICVDNVKHSSIPPR